MRANWLPIATISFLSALGLKAQQVVLEDFSSIRQNVGGSALWSVYVGEDPDQSSALISGMMQVIGSKKTGCTYTGCGVYFQFMPYPYTAPAGWAKNWIRSGTWDANVNRLRFQVKCSQNVVRRSDGGGSIDLGTYIKSSDNPDAGTQGAHYYHSVNPNLYSNRWMMVELNRVPQHEVGDATGVNYPEDPEWVTPTTGNGRVHYFDGLTRFYFDSTAQDTGWSGQTCYFDNYVFDTQSGSPDTLVSSITATHNGNAYEVTWNTAKESNYTYHVRYSTSSMKAAGFNSGTDGGIVAPDSPQSDYTGVFWNSPNMAEASTGLYVAIQPVGQSSFTEIFIPAMNMSTTNPCDINGDGAVDSLDINLAQAAALGTSGCTADLDNDGRCTVVDLQRVINASTGSVCRVGP